ncbi:Protein of unknown function DUF4128 [uncultured Caudovirales phage]|uniref:Tail protein n=1 Tax=uncultured Caudovirales phage TaxID=2100421 RepID=A0A6J5LB42_9CAUD|nr:Protein of unknown function DUF4128 [uncultured Caudovirales phage]
MSAATFHVDLRAAFRTRLATLAGLPAIAYEGKVADPKVGTPWISESMRPISSTVMATGLGGTISHVTMATLTLHYPSGAGTLTLETMAGLLMEHFRPGTVLAYESAGAVVTKVERTGLIQEPDWINGTVIVTLIGHTVN